VAAPTKKPLPIQQSAKMPDTDFDRVSEQRRVKDVESARSLFNRMMMDNGMRFSQIVNVRNQLEGGRPFDPKQLEEQGAAWQTNINFGDAQAARDRTLLPYFKMINDVPNKIAVTITAGGPQTAKWQAAFSEAYDNYIDDLGASYYVEFGVFSSNFVNFGPGIFHWPDPDSPRRKAVNVQRCLWPKNARMSPDEWEVMAFVQDMSPSDLYQKVRNPQETKRNQHLGWNADAIKAAIVTFNTGVFTPDPRDYTRWQDMLVNNDIAVATPFEPLQLVWLFVKQFSGKIGCYVFTQQGGVGEFLFEDEEYADNFRNILGAVWYDTGTDSMIHSIKGFGIKNYFFSTMLNRTKSRLVDAATLASGMNFQRGEDNVPDETPPVENYGPCTIFPPGMQQLTIAPNIQATVGIIEMLEGNQSQNNSLYRDQQQSEIASTDTAKQAEILATMQADSTQASSSIFLSQYGDNVLTEDVRRLRKKGSSDPDAKTFQQYLKDLGVPDTIIHDAKIRVRCGASAGMANPAVRAQKFQQGMALRNIPGVNSRWFLEQWIATVYGAAAVDKALLPEGQDSNPGQRRAAEQENVDFGQGVMLHAIPEDAHFEHLQEHLKPLAQIAMQFRGSGQITPEQTTGLTIGLEHGAEHMQYLSQDPSMKEQFQQVNAIFREVQSVARGILTRMSQGNPQSPISKTG
jgi:hypothetical protein